MSHFHFFFLNSDLLNLIKQNLFYIFSNISSAFSIYPGKPSIFLLTDYTEAFFWLPALNYYSQEIWGFWNFSDTYGFFIYMIPFFCLFGFLADLFHFIFRRWTPWTFDEVDNDDSSVYDSDTITGSDEDDEEEEEDYEPDVQFPLSSVVSRQELFVFLENLRDPRLLYVTFDYYRVVTGEFYRTASLSWSYDEVNEMYYDDLLLTWNEFDLILAAFFFGLIMVVENADLGQYYGVFGREFPNTMTRHLQIETIRLVSSGDLEFFQYSLDRGFSELTAFFDNYVFSNSRDVISKKMPYYQFYWDNFFLEVEPYSEVKKILDYNLPQQVDVHVDSLVLEKQLKFSRYRNMLRDDSFLGKQYRGLSIKPLDPPAFSLSSRTRSEWLGLRKFVKGRAALGLSKDNLGDYLAHMRLYDLLLTRHKGARRIGFVPHHLSTKALLPRWVPFGHLYTFYNPSSKFFSLSKIESSFQLAVQRNMRHSWFLKLLKNKYLNTLFISLQGPQIHFSKKVGKFHKNIMLDGLFNDSIRSHFQACCWDFVSLLKHEGGIYFFIDETYRIPRNRKFAKIDTRIALKAFKRSLRVFIFNQTCLQIYQSKYGPTLGSFFFSAPGGSLSFFNYTLENMSIDWSWYKSTHFVSFPDLTFNFNQVRSKQLDLYGTSGFSYSFLNNEKDNLLSSYPAFTTLPDIDTFWAAGRRVDADRAENIEVGTHSFRGSTYKGFPVTGSLFLSPLATFSLQNQIFVEKLFAVLYSFRPLFNRNSIIVNMFLDPIGLYLTQKQLYKYFLQDVIGNSFSSFSLSKYMSLFIQMPHDSYLTNIFLNNVKKADETLEMPEDFLGHIQVPYSDTYYSFFTLFFSNYVRNYYSSRGSSYVLMFEDFLLTPGHFVFENNESEDFYEYWKPLIFSFIQENFMLYKTNFVLSQFLYEYKKPYLYTAEEMHFEKLLEMLSEFAVFKKDIIALHKKYPFQVIQYHVMLPDYGAKTWSDVWPFWRKMPSLLPVCVNDNPVVLPNQNKYYPYDGHEFSRLFYTEPFYRFWTNRIQTDDRFVGIFDIFLDPTINPDNTSFCSDVDAVESLEHQEVADVLYTEDLMDYVATEYGSLYEITMLDSFYSTSVVWSNVDWMTRFIFFLHGLSCDNNGTFHLATLRGASHSGFEKFIPDLDSDLTYWNQEAFDDSIFQSYYHPFSYSSTPLQRLDGFLVQATFGNMKMGLDFEDLPYAIDDVDEWDVDGDLVEWLGEDLDPRFGSVLPSFSIDGDLGSFDWEVLNEEYFFIPDSPFPVMDVSDDEDDNELYELDFTDPDDYFEHNPYKKIIKEPHVNFLPGPAVYFITNVFPTVAWHGYPIPITNNGWVVINWFWRIGHQNHINSMWTYHGLESFRTLFKRPQKSFNSFFSDGFGLFYQSFRGRLYPTLFAMSPLVGSSRFFHASKTYGHGFDLTLNFSRTFVPEDYCLEGEEYEDSLLGDENYEDEEEDDDIEFGDDGEEFIFDEWGFENSLAKLYRQESLLGNKKTIYNYKSLWKLLGIPFGDLENPDEDYMTGSSISAYIRFSAFAKGLGWRQLMQDSQGLLLYPLWKLAIPIPYFHDVFFKSYSYGPTFFTSENPFFPSFFTKLVNSFSDWEIKLGKFLYKWTVKWDWYKPELFPKRRRYLRYKLPMAWEFGTYSTFDLRKLSREEWYGLLSRLWIFNFYNPSPQINARLFTIPPFGSGSLFSFSEYLNSENIQKYSSFPNFSLSYVEEDDMSREVYFDILNEYEEHQRRYRFPLKRKPVHLTKRWRIPLIFSGYLHCVSRYSFTCSGFVFNDFLCQEKGIAFFNTDERFYRISLTRLTWWPSSFFRYLLFRFLIFYSSYLNVPVLDLNHIVEILYFSANNSDFFHLCFVFFLSLFFQIGVHA